MITINVLVGVDVRERQLALDSSFSLNAMPLPHHLCTVEQLLEVRFLLQFQGFRQQRRATWPILVFRLVISSFAGLLLGPSFCFSFGS